MLPTRSENAHSLHLGVQHTMPASPALWRLAYAPGLLQLHLPSPYGAIRDTRLFLDVCLIATLFEQRLDMVLLLLEVSFALGTC